MRNLGKLVLVGMMCCTVAAAATDVDSMRALVKKVSTDIEGSVDRVAKVNALIQTIDYIVECYNLIEHNAANIENILEEVSETQRGDCVVKLEKVRNMLEGSGRAIGQLRDVFADIINPQGRFAEAEGFFRMRNLADGYQLGTVLIQDAEKALKNVRVSFEHGDAYNFALQVKRTFAETNVAEHAVDFADQIISYTSIVLDFFNRLEGEYSKQFKNMVASARRKITTP
jgi:hypothetical protein